MAVQAASTCPCVSSLFPMDILFLSSRVSMSNSPVSIYSASLGGDMGNITILFVILFSIWFSFFFCVLAGFLVSLSYVMIGIRHVVISFHIISIGMSLKWRWLTMASIVWYAASSCLSICAIWSLMFLFSQWSFPLGTYMCLSGPV